MIKRTITIFCVLVLMTCMCYSFLPTAKDSEIYDNAIRLHVIANSNDACDQALKLKIRDRILLDLKELMQEAKSKDNAQEIINKNISKLKESALSVVKENNKEYDINITLNEEYYPTREYEHVTMPSGKYLSLRVLCGKAQGHNWWCVLYPPLCTGTAKAKDTLKEAGFTKEQIKILCDNETPKYKIKFKILELFEKITDN